MFRVVRDYELLLEGDRARDLFDLYGRLRFFKDLRGYAAVKS